MAPKSNVNVNIIISTVSNCFAKFCFVKEIMVRGKNRTTLRWSLLLHGQYKAQDIFLIFKYEWFSSADFQIYKHKTFTV